MAFYFQLEDNEMRLIETEEDSAMVAYSCAKNADSFYQLSHKALSSFDTEPGFSPAIQACLAFSCELYLKTLLYLSKKSPRRIHNLGLLYKRLDLEIKNQIYELHPKGNCPPNLLPNYFDLQIKEWRKGFEVLRYSHERQGYACNFQFLLELSDTLRIIAVEKCAIAINKLSLNGAYKFKDIPPFSLSQTLAKMNLYYCPTDSRAFMIAYNGVASSRNEMSQPSQ